MFSRIFSVIHFNPLALTWGYSKNIEQNMYGDSSYLNSPPNELPISAIFSRRLRIPLFGVTAVVAVIVVLALLSSLAQESAGISQDSSIWLIPVRKNSKVEDILYIFLLIFMISSLVISSLSNLLSFPSTSLPMNTCPFSLILLVILLIAGTSLSLIIPTTACLPR